MHLENKLLCQGNSEPGAAYLRCWLRCWKYWSREWTVVNKYPVDDIRSSALVYPECILGQCFSLPAGKKKKPTFLWPRLWSWGLEGSHRQSLLGNHIRVESPCSKYMPSFGKKEPWLCVPWGWHFVLLNRLVAIPAVLFCLPSNGKSHWELTLHPGQTMGPSYSMDAICCCIQHSLAEIMPSRPHLVGFQDVGLVSLFWEAKIHLVGIRATFTSRQSVSSCQFSGHGGILMPEVHQLVDFKPEILKTEPHIVAYPSSCLVTLGERNWQHAGHNFSSDIRTDGGA